MENGVLIIDKTIGPSSFDVVREIRKWTAIKRVGHAGSLDPFATGVLVILTGKATKLSNALLNADKRYRAVIKLGEATDSMDCTGQVTSQEAIPALSVESIKTCLASFVGEWLMTPPMYSAKKVQGVRLYELARKNITIKREPIPVELYDLKLVSFDGTFLEFEVHCSKGTYIRSLGDEIAKRLGTLGHLTALRRLSCGPFSIEQSLTVDSLKNSAPDWQQEAYRNYVKLLSAEGVVRPKVPLYSESKNGLGMRDESEMSHSQFSHLPRPGNNDMSYVN